MKSIPIVTGAGVLLVALVTAQLDNRAAPGQQTQPLPKVPRTVDEAVLILKTKWLSPKDLDWILRNPQEEVVFRMYRPFGTGVRNEFGLWSGNQELRDSCRNNDPEECSMVIFNRLWQSVRTDAEPSLVRQIDCQFQLAETIHINHKGFHKLTTSGLVKAMQLQIDEQLAMLAATGTPMCQRSLTLEVAGKPDMDCFVAAPFGKHHGDEAKDRTLERTLGGLGLTNLFTSSHVPPKIILNFARKCQFPTPPYLYGSPNRY